MSEADNPETAVLLPGATVSVFTNDKETAETAESLGGDWRFARVEIGVYSGDVETAIATFQARESTDLVIVQTDVIDEGFAGRLEALAGFCKEDTAAIVIGPVNDVYLYRKLVAMGVNDYLVRPVKPEVLSEVIAKTLIERIGAFGSHLIAVVGAKGGVGTSAIAQALAWGLADTLRQKTMLLDAAGGWSSASVGMAFEPTTTLAAAIRSAENADEEGLNRMLFKASDKLSVLATGGDTMLEQALIPDQLETLLDTLMTKFPAVVIDLSQAPAMAKRSIMARAHRILLVSTPTLTGLRLARTLLHEIKDVRGGSSADVDLVINMQGMAPAVEVPKGDIEPALECKPAAVIPYNAKLFLGLENQGKKLSSDKAGMDVVATLLPLVRKVVGDAGDGGAGQGDDKGGGGLGAFLNILKPKG